MKKQLIFINELTGELSDEPNQGFRDFVHDHIKSFNDSISPYHRLARKSGIEPLQLQVLDIEKNVVGGLIADTYWGWLDIDDFWIDENYRRQGLGKEMLEAAEDEAAARNCKFVQLKTFSFQAKEFYEKCGYRVVGELRDYPPGHSLFWMRKDLN